MALRKQPVLLVLAGAAGTAASGVFVKLSGVEAGSAAFWRCALALLVLVPLAVAECRRAGARPRRLLALDAAAGVLLGIDFVLWAACVLNLGASVAAVLLNVQVIVFPLLTRLVSKTALPGRFLLTVPVMLAGVALAGGVVGGEETGADPVTGLLQGVASGVAYAGYLFFTRLGGIARTADGYGGDGRSHAALPVCVSTATAAAAAAALGGTWTGLSLPGSAASWGWLAALALAGQVLAWLFIGAALPRLAPDVGAALLLLQPVLAVAAGVVFLGERLTGWQVAGSVLVVAAVWHAGRGGGGRARDGSVRTDPPHRTEPHRTEPHRTEPRWTEPHRTERPHRTEKGFARRESAP